MYNIAICDDNISDIDFLKSKIQKVDILKDDIKFTTYNSGEAFIKHLDRKYDCVFMDLQMQQLDGFKTAEILREYDQAVMIIFCSGICPPQSESFHVQPFAYLLKDMPVEKLESELERILKQLQFIKGSSVVTGKLANQSYSISCREITYIEITKRGCHIWLKSAIVNIDSLKPLFSTEKLKDHYDNLKFHGFAYAHNSYIVNLDYIKMITENRVLLINGIELNVSRSQMKQLKEKWAKYISKR
jgi:DNA-binding LytR/AlgR family response regulator